MSMLYTNSCMQVGWCGSSSYWKWNKNKLKLPWGTEKSFLHVPCQRWHNWMKELSY